MAIQTIQVLAIQSNPSFLFRPSRSIGWWIVRRPDVLSPPFCPENPHQYLVAKSDLRKIVYMQLVPIITYIKLCSEERKYGI